LLLRKALYAIVFAEKVGFHKLRMSASSLPETSLGGKAPALAFGGKDLLKWPVYSVLGGKIRPYG